MFSPRAALLRYAQSKATSKLVAVAPLVFWMRASIKPLASSSAPVGWSTNAPSADGE